MPKLKMYIIVRDDILLGIAVNSIAHTSLATYLKFKDEPIIKEWLETSFNKVTCVVNNNEFEKAKSEADCVIITESSLENKEVAIGFLPRVEWPKYFKFFRLLK
jgi:peptidyl-tRNA hydrolase